LATVVTYNGVSYSIPGIGESNWGGVIGVDGILVALAQNTLSTGGGLFALSADLDFGPSAGLVAAYFKSRSSNLPATGTFRLANGDTIAFRNHANSADLALSVNASDQLTFGGSGLISGNSTTTLQNKLFGDASDATKTVGFSTSGSTTGKAVTLLFAATGNRTLTFPDVTDNVVTRTSTDTLTNKTLTQPVISGSGGTLTLPAGPDTLVGRATTDTLTNKTMVYSSNTFSGIFSPTVQANIGLSASVGSSALTIALKTKAGTDASATDKVVIGFRNATLTTGTYQERTVSAALSIVVPSSATLGQASANSEYVYVYAIDNAGTVELAVSGRKIFDETTVQSSTTISSSATSGNTLYSTTGRSNVAIKLIGRLLVSEATAGTWASAPSEIDLGSFQLGQYPTIACRYNTAAGQSISASTNTAIVFDTKDFDTHLAFNTSTGVFTVPVAGYYRISSFITFAGTTWTITTSATIQVFKGGSAVSQLGNLYTQDATDSFPKPVGGSDLLKFVAGDTVDIRAFQNNAGAKSLEATAIHNYVSIQFVGI
jgi:hypothetical protein